MGGFADSKILNIHGERMVERNFVPGGPAEYELKDLRTAQALAAASGLHFTLLDCLVGMFGDMIDQFGNGLDVAGILQEVERRSGGDGHEGIAMTGHVTLTVHDGIGQIVLDRPDKHQCDHAGDDAGIAARLPRDRRRTGDIRVATITGAGERAFSAGSDLNTLADLSDVMAFRNRVEYAALVRDIRKPVIAGLKGWVLGGGMEIALCGRYPHRRPQRQDRRAGSDPRLARRRRRVADAAASGRRRARRCGCCSPAIRSMRKRRCASGWSKRSSTTRMCWRASMEIAKKIASFSPTATQAIKAAVRAALSMPLEAGTALRERPPCHLHVGQVAASKASRRFRKSATPSSSGA